jgi:hypothetical protein
MGIRDMFRRGQDGPALYRRAWTESNDPVVTEARAQTLAIQRLEVWLRLVYSALAFAVLLGYWGYAEGGGRAPLVAGIVLGVVAFGCVIVLRTGISHGRANVQAMLAELEKRKSEKAPS